MDKIPATTQIFLAQIMKFPDFSLTFLIFKISLTNLQNSLTFSWPWRKIKFPWLFPDQWPHYNLYFWCQILAKFNVNQIWLTTWLFVYVPASNYKTHPSEKNCFVGWLVGLNGRIDIVKWQAQTNMPPQLLQSWGPTKLDIPSVFVAPCWRREIFLLLCGHIQTRQELYNDLTEIRK